MDGFQMFRLGSLLRKIAQDSVPDTGFSQLPVSTRLILFDALAHPGSSITEITERSGLPQALVAAAVATLTENGALVTAPDPHDAQRDVVDMAPSLRQRAAAIPFPTVDTAVGDALGAHDQQAIAEVLAALETLAARLPNARIPRATPDFSAAYEGIPPWDIGRPQPAFVALAEAGAFRGHVLDVGCGTGEQTLLAASRGLPSTGLDSVPAAIAKAQEKARRRGLSDRVSFVQGDALDLEALGQSFDTVIDCGFFHVLSDEDRVRYVETLSAVANPGARYFLLCFSDRQPGTMGPRRIAQREIRETFASGWRVDSIEAAAFETTMTPDIQAWLAALTRAG